MARIRSIKPGFFASEDVAVLPFRARLTWIGLWTYVDDEGRTKDNPRIIKGALYSLEDVTAEDVEQDLATLAENGRIIRYNIAGQRYLEIVNFLDHQKIPKPTPSRLPPPSAAMTDRKTAPVSSNGRPNTRKAAAVSSNDGLTNAPVSSNDGLFREPSTGCGQPATTGVLPESYRSPTGGKGSGSGSGSGKEGDAREHGVPRELTTVDSTEPPRKCPEHLKTRNPPACGKCKDARQEHDEWHTAQRARIAASPKCTRHRGQPADNCAMCRSELLAGERTRP